MHFLQNHCKPYALLFQAAGFPLEQISTDAQLVAACDMVLRQADLGGVRQAITMIRNAVAPEVSLTDRLALRAVLNGDVDRAARVWRAEFEGKPVDAIDPGAADKN